MVLAGSTLTQKHLYAAEQVDSALCPYCEEQVEDTMDHILWHCSAWKEDRV